MILVFDNSEIKQPASYPLEGVTSYFTEEDDGDFYFLMGNTSGNRATVPLGKTPSPELIWLAIAYGKALGLACLIINEYDFDQTLADLTKQISSRQLREESLIWTSKR